MQAELTASFDKLIWKYAAITAQTLIMVDVRRYLENWESCKTDFAATLR
jgi:hypothetical protein